MHWQPLYEHEAKAKKIIGTITNSNGYLLSRLFFFSFFNLERGVIQFVSLVILKEVTRGLNPGPNVC